MPVSGSLHFKGFRPLNEQSLNNCEETLEDSSFRFAVYPNGTDAFIVSTQQMLEDLLEELDLIE